MTLDVSCSVGGPPRRDPNGPYSQGGYPASPWSVAPGRKTSCPFRLPAKIFAPPVRRVQIPKGDGSKTRPIGIPTFEDKVLQRAVLMALEAVYEQDFYDFSYGFRPNRSAHQALDSLWNKLIKMGARVVRHARAITFQLAEVAVTGPMVRAILAAIHRLRVPPLCA